MAPAFASHHALPSLELAGGAATVMVGQLGGVRSPAQTFSPIVGAELRGTPGARLSLPLERDFEHALVPLSGECTLDGEPLAVDTLYYLGCERRELVLAVGAQPLRALLLGGAPFGETILMWWNFVARTTEEIVAAREDWQEGRRFGEVRAYAGDRLPAPAFLARPVPRG